MATKNQIKSILDRLSIAYAPKANHEVLTALISAVPADQLLEHEVLALGLETAPVSDPESGLPLTDGTEGPLYLDFVVPEGSDIRELNCPHCGVGLDNGVLHPDDEAHHAGGTYTPSRTLWENGELNRDYQCMGCGGEFGAVLDPYVAPVQGTGLKIEKDREEKNGIKRPSIGGKCRAIWDALDAHAEASGDDPTAKDVKELAATNGWNPNNASIEFYQWRKFNGITGRAAKPTPPTA